MKRFILKNLFIRSNTSSAFKERRKHERLENGYDHTILVVDDSRTAVAAFTKMLSQAGFDVISAFNGVDGVAKAKLRQPNLILMDIVMPGLNGFQATRQIRQDPSSAHIPIIIVSGEQQATEQLWGKRVGANGFLTKPVDRGEFFRQILELLGKDTLAIN
jgi:twitching motility two-component system response regulator PilH